MKKMIMLVRAVTTVNHRKIPKRYILHFLFFLSFPEGVMFFRYAGGL